MLLQVASAGQGLERHLSTSVAGGDVLSPTVLLNGGTLVGLVAAKVVAMLTVVLVVGGASEGLVTGMFSSVTLPGFAGVGSMASVLLPVVYPCLVAVGV